MMSVRVVARVRPLLNSELGKDIIVSSEAAGQDGQGSPTLIRIPNPKNESESYTFQFNSVYEQHATQQAIFEQEVAPTVKHLFNGFDVTIFAYGVTGTGKTHTMRGGKSLADRGVIPRLLSSIYRRCRKVEKDTAGTTQVEVAMSYYEIYNDKVYDLFESPERRTPAGLPIRENNGKSIVVGLTERPCTTLKEFEQLYDQANVNRSTSATKLNAHSSRSHAILCVKLTQTTETTVRISRTSAIDLAGSEDNRRTDNNRERLVESSSINKSLFVLAQCVEAISKGQSRIPYRESKMTRILSLGQNNGLTVMILNLSPLRTYHLDTLSSLNFANRTKKITVREIENEPTSKTDGKKPLVACSISGKNIQRQPLRPLSAAQNTMNASAFKRMERPVKEFAVYSDARKMASKTGSSLAPARGSNEPPKRRAEPLVHARCAKAIRSSGPQSCPREPTLSAAAIEAIIDAKLSEKFAERALSDADATSSKALPPELQRRLDQLEQRIEASADKSKEEGLHFLMMAKQHSARGEDASALRMFRLAVPYFPANIRLERKIAALQGRLRERPLEQQPLAGNTNHQNLVESISRLSPLYSPIAGQGFKGADANDEHTEQYLFDNDEGSGGLYKDSASSTCSAVEIDNARSSVQSTLVMGGHSAKDGTPHAFNDPGPPTPRTSRLLRIMNSKDSSQIRALRGVGAKRAEVIVKCLSEVSDAEVKDLRILAELKGVGIKLVNNMRAGLEALDV